jgi:hypothetical protein
MYNKMDMLVQFPNMVIQNLEGTKYDGYINVMVTMVFICFSNTHGWFIILLCIYADALEFSVFR